VVVNVLLYILNKIIGLGSEIETGVLHHFNDGLGSLSLTETGSEPGPEVMWQSHESHMINHVRSPEFLNGVPPEAGEPGVQHERDK
jgi:hypothetical protein